MWEALLFFFAKYWYQGDLRSPLFYFCLADSPPHCGHSTSSAPCSWGSVDLLITGSEVHYQCAHCQPSWLGLCEGHTDLIRHSWVLITSQVKIRLWFHWRLLAQVVPKVMRREWHSAWTKWCSTIPDVFVCFFFLWWGGKLIACR